MFRMSKNWLFEYVFATVLAYHHGGPRSIPGREISISGAVTEDDLGQASLYCILHRRFLKVEVS